MYNKSIKQLSDSLHKKELSSVELCQYFFERIKRYDGDLNSVITLNEENHEWKSFQRKGSVLTT